MQTVVIVLDHKTETIVPIPLTAGLVKTARGAQIRSTAQGQVIQFIAHEGEQVPRWSVGSYSGPSRRWQMSEREIRFEELTLDCLGRARISDELCDLVLDSANIVSAGAANTTNCTGTTNGGCTNAQLCAGSSNGGCSNPYYCYQSQNTIC